MNVPLVHIKSNINIKLELVHKIYLGLQVLSLGNSGGELTRTVHVGSDNPVGVVMVMCCSILYLAYERSVTEKES